MPKEQISHWVILHGNPLACCNTRADARKRNKELRIKHDSKSGYLYLGKCIQRGSKEYLIFEL